MGRRKLLTHYSSSDSDESLLNLTPLIDVVFVVLIIFILIAPMLEIDKIQLANAAHKDSKETKAVQENSPISIHVHEDNSIWFQSKRISPEALVPLLQQARKQTPHKTPQLFQDKRAQFGTYQLIKNAVELAGFEELDVILQPG